MHFLAPEVTYDDVIVVMWTFKIKSQGCLPQYLPVANHPSSPVITCHNHQELGGLLPLEQLDLSFEKQHNRKAAMVLILHVFRWFFPMHHAVAQFARSIQRTASKRVGKQHWPRSSVKLTRIRAGDFFKDPRWSTRTAQESSTF